ncbi:MAG: hypothetical protein J6K16_00070 [Alphaproteobacteria bacterium]|nr:hypothetical protein [Alphaproteobacteria bacterium]
MDLLKKVSGIIKKVSNDVIMPNFYNLRRDPSFRENAAEVVTQADIESERHLIHELSKIIPNSLVVSEEWSKNYPYISTCFEDRNVKNLWVIDPLDGTQNFINKSENFAVAVTLMERGHPVAAWIYLPYKKQMLYGDEVHGVFLNDQKLNFSNQVSKIKKMDANGALAPYVGKSVKLMRAHSCSCSYFNLITQKTDAVVFSKKLLPWDHTAGAFLHKCSGGFNAFIDGTRYTPARDGVNTLILAPNKRLWMELRGKTRSWLQQMEQENDIIKQFKGRRR